MLLNSLGSVSHAADPLKKFTYPQNLGENSKAAADARAKATAHGEAVIAARERRAGRKLTQREQFNGLADREPMTIDERMAHESWRPVVGKDTRSQMERVADSLARPKTALEEAYKLQGPARWEALARASTSIDDEAAEQAAAAAAHLESEPVAAALSEINSIRHSMLWDPSRTSGELAALERVESQWREPQGDRRVARDMLRAVRTAEVQRHTDAVAGKSAAIAAAQQVLIELVASAPSPVEGGDE